MMKSSWHTSLQALAAIVSLISAAQGAHAQVAVYGAVSPPTVQTTLRRPTISTGAVARFAERAGPLGTQIRVGLLRIEADGELLWHPAHGRPGYFGLPQQGAVVGALLPNTYAALQVTTLSQSIPLQDRGASTGLAVLSDSAAAYASDLALYTGTPSTGFQSLMTFQLPGRGMRMTTASFLPPSVPPPCGGRASPPVIPDVLVASGNVLHVIRHAWICTGDLFNQRIEGSATLVDVPLAGLPADEVVALGAFPLQGASPSEPQHGVWIALESGGIHALTWAPGAPLVSSVQTPRVFAGTVTSGFGGAFVGVVESLPLGFTQVQGFTAQADPMSTPVIAPLFTNGPALLAPSRVLAGDYTGDGTLDVLTARLEPSRGVVLRYYRNVAAVSGGERPALDQVDSSAFNANPGGIMDVLAADFDADGAMDFAVLPGKPGDVNPVMVFRGRPPPEATYISAYAHGQNGEMFFNSYVDRPLLTLQQGQPIPPEELITDRHGAMNDYASALRRAFAEIDNRRRPANQPNMGDSDLPPVDFFHVPVHWEVDTARGTAETAYSRGAFIASMAVPVGVPPPPCVRASPVDPLLALPTPGLLPLAPRSGPGTEPVQYWEQILLHARSAYICAAPPPNPPAVLSPPPEWTARLALASLGGALELASRTQTSVASRSISARMANQVLGAAHEARIRMSAGGNPCDGSLFIDMVGHSRGAAVVGGAIQFLNVEPQSELYFSGNTEVRTVYLDAIDRTGGDNLRPWIQSGFSMNDPYVRRRRNESIIHSQAQFTSNRDNSIASYFPPLALLAPSATVAALDALLPVRVVGYPETPGSQCATQPHSCIAPSPVGFRRFDLLSMGLDPSGSDELFLAGAPHGDVGPKFQALPNGGVADSVRAAQAAPGQLDVLVSSAGRASHWSATTLSGQLALATPRARPSAARGWLGGPGSTTNGTACSVGFPDRAPRLSAQALAAGAEGNIIRDLLPDSGFRALLGVRESARWVDSLSDAKEVLAGSPAMAQVVSSYAHADFPPAGNWQRSGSGPRLETVGSVSREGLSGELYARHDVDLDATDDDLANQLEGARARLDAADGLLRESQLRLLRVASGVDGTVQARVVFPADNTETVRSRLDVASTALTQMHVYVDFQLDAGGVLLVSVAGAGTAWTRVLRAADVGTQRQSRWLALERTLLEPSDVLDELAIGGHSVAVYQLAARTAGPVFHAASGSHFELVVDAEGVDASDAARRAVAARFDGRPGRLAVIRDAAQLAWLHSAFAQDVDAWVGASFRAGAWEWADGGAVQASLLSGHTRGEDHAVLEYGTGSLSSAPATTHRHERPVGYFIEYPPGASTPTGSNVTVPWAPFLVTFAEVAVAGTTLVSTSSSAPAFMPPAWTPVSAFFDVSTSAETQGSKTLCADGDFPPGAVVLHLDGGSWRPLETVRTGTRVCAETADLSWFVVAVPRVFLPPEFEGHVPLVVLEQASPGGTPYDLPKPVALDQDGRLVPVHSTAPSTFPNGDTLVWFTAVDRWQGVAQVTTLVRVVDSLAPVMDSPLPDIILEAEGAHGVHAELVQPIATDAADGAPLVVSNAPAVFPLGDTLVEWTATDASGNVSTAFQWVLVLDSTPPTIEALVACPSIILVSRGHAYGRTERVLLSVRASDAVSLSTTCHVTGVLCDGFPCPSAEWRQESELQLRVAARSSEQGRVYGFQLRCVDGAGNSADAVVDAVVEERQPGPPPVDSRCPG